LTASLALQKCVDGDDDGYFIIIIIIIIIIIVNKCTSCCQQGHLGSKTLLQKILQFLTGLPSNTDWPVYHTTPQPFYSPFFGTTQVSRCQKRTSGLYGARED